MKNKKKVSVPEMTMLATPDESTTTLASPKKRSSPPMVVEIPAQCPHCLQYGNSESYGTKTEPDGVMMLPGGIIHRGVVRRYKRCGTCGKNYVTASPI